eukprot:COSAG02_NODE_2030_length_10067_cov_22.885333_6_plen_93_part_00
MIHVGSYSSASHGHNVLSMIVLGLQRREFDETVLKNNGQMQTTHGSCGTHFLCLCAFFPSRPTLAANFEVDLYNHIGGHDYTGVQQSSHRWR